MQVSPFDTSALAPAPSPAETDWALWLLALLAATAAAIVIWKLIDLSVKRSRAARLLARIDDLLERRMIAEALAEARAADSAIGRILAAGLARRAAGAVQVARSLENARAIETAELERGLIPLATIAAVAPLLGFLGSVLALMRALEQPGVVAGGALASALVPAAAGLAIALVTTLMHAYFVARVARIVVDVSGSAQRAVDAVDDTREDAAP